LSKIREKSGSLESKENNILKAGLISSQESKKLILLLSLPRRRTRRRLAATTHTLQRQCSAITV
jgi:hypothetical protein